MKTILCLLLLAPCSVLQAQVVVQPPGIRAILPGPGITVNTNGFTRTISAPGAAGDITGGAATGGLLTVSENAGILTYGLTTNAVRSAVDVPARIADQTIAPDRIEGDGILTIVGTDGMVIQADASGLSAIEVSGITTTNSVDAASINATDSITIGGTNVLTEASQINGANITNQVVVLRGDQWTGPQVSEKPGWAIKSFDLAGETKLLARGFQDFSGTQYTATADSEFRTPTDATAFRTTAAILVTILADSTTSSICSYRLYVYKNATQIYDSGASQTVASTSAKHVVSIPASSLGTFTAGATYTVRVEASVKYDSSVAKGIYFVGTPTIQVIK